MSAREARRIVDGFLEASLAGLLAFMVLAVLWQVFTRFVLMRPSSITEELVRFGLVWLSLLGASYGFGKRSHLAIDLLPRRLREGASAVVVAGFALAVLIAGGSRLTSLTLALGQRSAALQVERGYVYVVLPLSGLLVLVYVVLDAFGSRRE